MRFALRFYFGTNRIQDILTSGILYKCGACTLSRVVMRNPLLVRQKVYATPIVPAIGGTVTVMVSLGSRPSLPKVSQKLLHVVFRKVHYRTILIARILRLPYRRKETIQCKVSFKWMIFIIFLSDGRCNLVVIHLFYAFGQRCSTPFAFSESVQHVRAPRLDLVAVSSDWIDVVLREAQQSRKFFPVSGQKHTQSTYFFGVEIILSCFLFSIAFWGEYVVLTRRTC